MKNSLIFALINLDNTHIKHFLRSLSKVIVLQTDRQTYRLNANETVTTPPGG